MLKRLPYLPGVLGEIAAVAGADAAVAVAMAKGGIPVLIQRKPKPDNWLAQLIGHELAIAVGEHFCASNSSLQVDVPLGPTSRDVARWQRIEALIGEGWSNRRIARETQCDYKTIQRIRNGKRKTIAQAIAAERNQGKLF